MKAILVGISTRYDRYDIEYSLNELKALAETLDIEVVDSFYQRLDKPNSRTYIGSGKLSELVIAINAYDIDLVIFNDELSPAQLRSCEDILKVEVMDRSFLILKIFELRAQSREAKLEIKLAKNMYMLPRIQFLREKEDRIGGGGSGATKGSGETQRELDRRHLMAEITHIQDELLQVRKMKANQIEKRKRNDIPIVALVGYTNAGKSTTMNTILKKCGALTTKEVLSKDQLFATLTTANRKLTYNKVDFMLVDTIGFVSKLPHNLVNSFYQTLEEIKNADLIIHVIDTSSIYLNQELDVVLQVLNELEVYDIPELYLLNKWDKTINLDMQVVGKKSLRFSNKTELNLDKLMDEIITEIAPSTIHSRLLIPYKNGDLSHMLEEKCHIYKKEYREAGTYFECEVPQRLYSQVADYDLDYLVS